jgi:acyl carrier protein
MAELVIDLEEEFNCTISEEQAQSIETVGQAIKFIEENSQ